MKIKFLFFLMFVVEALFVKFHIDNGKYGFAAFIALTAIYLIPLVHQDWNL